jgi:DNA-binding winged helix-turn-helix (wHTH) protein
MYSAVKARGMSNASLSGSREERMGAEPNLRALRQAPFRGLRFGPFELDTGSAELWKSGARVKLQLQPFRVLALLASQPGRLLTREEIQREVWSDGTYVDFEQALNFCIRQIRAALGDQATTPRYIETLPRRGYRFIGEVEVIEPPPAADATPAEGTPPPPPAAEIPTVRLFPRLAPVAARSWLETVSRRLAPWVAGLALGLIVATTIAWLRTGTQAPAFHRLTFGRGSLGAARFAPSGEVIYSAAFEGRPLAVFAVREEQLDPRPIADAGPWLVGVSAAGEVAFLGEGKPGTGATLTRVPLAGGPAKEVLADVRAADWAAERDAFVVVRGSGALRRIEYPIGTVLCEALRPTHVRLSPQRDRVAFLEHPMRGDDRGDVVVVDRKGVRTTLSADWASAQGLAWSPDGREVWFTASKAGADNALHAVTLDRRLRMVTPALGRLILHDIAPDGRVLVERTTFRQETYFRSQGEEGERDLSWLDLSRLIQLTPDGRRILFVESGEGGGPEYTTYLRRTDGSVPVRIGHGSPTALSPDGAWVLTVPVLARDRLQLVPTGAGEVRIIQDPGIIDYEWAGFLPGGREIVFAGRERGQETRMYVRPIGSGPARAFTPPGVAVWLNTLSPDGSALAAPCGERWCLYPLGGGEPRPIAGTEGRSVIGWGGDDTLYLREPQRLPARLLRLHLPTARVEPWREIAPADRSGVVGINQVLVTPDGRAYAYTFSRLLSDLYVLTGLR